MKVDLEGEIWKDVVGFEGLYQVSNLGRVYALPKEWTTGRNTLRGHDGIIMLCNPSNRGYKCATLRIDGKLKVKEVHQLVAEAFLNHKPNGHKIVIDHINNNPLDNRVENLQIVTNRFNVYKTQCKYTSKYKGVCWDGTRNLWRSQIHIKGKKIYLGMYDCELKAYLAYQNKLKELNNLVD